MRIVDIEDLGNALPSIIEDATERGKEALIRVRGKDVAAIVPIASYQLLLQEMQLARRRLDGAVESNRVLNANVPPEELESEVLRAVHDVRKGKGTRPPPS